MLRWIVKPVESPYGTVDTVHWAVPDEVGGEDGVRGASARAASDAAHGSGEADAETALQVELESAEDTLGAVLWNSNTVALDYLDKHILRHRQQTNRQTAPAAPPLEGLRVVELGAGVGCLGIALAMGGADVAVTDLKELVPLMRHNVALNRRKWSGKQRGGRCEAMEWKWGPSVSLNPKKYTGTATTSRNSGGDAQKGSRASHADDVAGAMLTALRAPSGPFCAAQRFFTTAKDQAEAAAPGAATAAVDYVILCDALYGNPKDWPSLLYTLSELLATNPAGCVIVNFCEQRVDNVEGAFLELLQQQNQRRSCSRSGLAEDDRAGDVKERVLQQVLCEKRGPYLWSFHTETVAEAPSELGMTVRATTIRWVAATADAMAEEGNRERENEEPVRKRAKKT